MIGPGKYDEECSKLRLSTKASGVLIVVIDGNKGQGFSCQMDLKSTLMLPELLRHMANQIEADMKQGKL